MSSDGTLLANLCVCAWHEFLWDLAFTTISTGVLPELYLSFGTSILVTNAILGRGYYSTPQYWGSTQYKMQLSD